MSRAPTAIFLGWDGVPASSAVKELIASRFDLRWARELAFGEPADQPALAALRADFLFSFGPLIVRRPLLESIGRGAINLHTAPPRWPGRGSCSLALLEGDAEFGVTAHLMHETVDSGPILRVIRFPIASDETAASLHTKTLARIPELALAVVEDLSRNGWSPRPIDERWSGPARRQEELLALMRIDEADPEELVERKIRAFAHPTKPGPYVERNGHRFWYHGPGARPGP